MFAVECESCGYYQEWELFSAADADQKHHSTHAPGHNVSLYGLNGEKLK